MAPSCFVTSWTRLSLLGPRTPAVLSTLPFEGRAASPQNKMCQVVGTLDLGESGRSAVDCWVRRENEPAWLDRIAFMIQEPPRARLQGRAPDIAPTSPPRPGARLCAEATERPLPFPCSAPLRVEPQPELFKRRTGGTRGHAAPPEVANEHWTVHAHDAADDRKRNVVPDSHAHHRGVLSIDTQRGMHFRGDVIKPLSDLGLGFVGGRAQYWRRFHWSMMLLALRQVSS